MIEGRPFLYQDIEGTLYYVDEEGFQVVLPNANQPWSSKGPIMAFIDGDNATYKPDDIVLDDPLVQIIVASSPKGASQDQRWIKQLSSRRDLTTLVTKLWSRKEILVTGSVLAFLLSMLD